MSNRARRLMAAALTGAVLLAPAFIPRVGAEQVLSREGVTGHAGLADIQDSPGAICTFIAPGPGSLGETVIRINPPVVFAADTTPGLDEQQVGWRASILTWVPDEHRWVVAAESPLATSAATDAMATYFEGKSWIHQTLLNTGVHEAQIEMLWFDPGAPEVVTGRITANIERYALLVQDQAGMTQAGVHSVCRAPERHRQDQQAQPPRPV